MNDEQINLDIALDIETELITAGRLAPLVACVSIYDQNKTSWLLSPDEACSYLLQWEASKGRIIGHNIAFDLYALCRHNNDLVPLVWRLYEQGRIWDTGIFERLYALWHGWTKHPTIGRPIISGGVSLAQLAQGLLGIDMSDFKFDPNSPRFRYGELVGVHPSEWGATERQYAMDDARITYQVFDAQFENFKRLKLSSEEIPSFSLQCRADWALHHLRAWGLRTDSAAVEKWRKDISVKKNILEISLQLEKILNGHKRDMKRIKELVEQAYGADVPRTEKGSIQTSTEVLEDSNDPNLKMLAEWMSLDKLTSTFEPTIAKAAQYPLCPRWNVLVRSGRTSCKDPNLQQLPQSGGIREAFRPREGYCFIGADYSTAELVALAQVCLNMDIPSRMADAIREGRDLHLALAADLANISYEEAVKRKAAKDKEINHLRRLAKIPNFGLPGGLGINGLLGFAKGYGVTLTEQEAIELKNAWYKSWPEMRRYFDNVRRDVDRGYVIQHETWRRRGGVGFTDAANTYFQGLIADGAKTALYEVVKEAWTQPASELYGSKPIMFIHDEIICEAPLDKAPAAAERLAHVMVEHMKKFLPDLPIQADAWCSMVWRKGLESERDAYGHLIIQG